jgi:hypothetical protein
MILILVVPSDKLPRLRMFVSLESSLFVIILDSTLWSLVFAEGEYTHSASFVQRDCRLYQTSYSFCVVCISDYANKVGASLSQHSICLSE